MAKLRPPGVLCGLTGEAGGVLLSGTWSVGRAGMPPLECAGGSCARSLLRETDACRSDKVSVERLVVAAEVDGRSDDDAEEEEEDEEGERIRVELYKSTLAKEREEVSLCEITAARTTASILEGTR